MRVLSAIIFADIEGYSALMQDDEKQALEYRNKFKSTLEENLEKYEGKIIQFYGDGALLTFSSGLKAVEYALKVQKEFQAEPKVPVRIGVHMGDVVIESDGIFGDSVNIASRIESIAVPGSILISDKIKDEIANQSHIETKSLGPQSFKNVEKEIEIFAVINKGVVNPEGINTEGKVSNRSYKIAVLPLNNFSEDAKLDILADSLTEEIISYLAMVPDFMVTSRTSTFAYKGKQENATKIGKELGVEMLVEGSIRKYMSQMRVTIQLIDIERGFHITAHNYDIPRIITLNVQDKLAQDIAKDILKSLDTANEDFDFGPKKKKSFFGGVIQFIFTGLIKYILAGLIAAAATLFIINHFNKDRDNEISQNSEMVVLVKDSVKHNVSNYLAALYESRHIYSGYNVSLSANFIMQSTPEKYDPFSSAYRDSSNTDKLEYNGILTDELAEFNYTCYFTLRSNEDSIKAMLKAVVKENGEITLSKIEYTEIISLINTPPDKDTLKTKKDSTGKKIKQTSDSIKNKVPKNLNK